MIFIGAFLFFLFPSTFLLPIGEKVKDEGASSLERLSHAIRHEKAFPQKELWESPSGLDLFCHY